MNRYLLSVLAGVVISSAGSFPVHAWSAQGHRLVAAVAETRLSPEARAEVAQLLEGEATPTLPGIAAWADELRGSDSTLARNSASWHYVNMGEENCQYSPQKHCKGGNCVIEALKTQMALLADHNLPRPERAQALKFVVHLVGDMHQPLHAGYAHDRGGNTLQVRYNGHGTNLHALWDGGMFYPLQLTDDQYLQRLMELPPVDAGTAPATAADTVVAWTTQTCRLAIRPDVYPKESRLHFFRRKPQVTEAYVETFRPQAEAQLRLGGERLAQVLNTLLQPAP